MFELLLAASLSIPLQSAGDWQVLAYQKIPAHKTVFNQEGLTVSVEGSASPVIYPLQTPVAVRSVKVRGHLNQVIPLDDPTLQGQKGFDDFSLRLGLVIKGDKRLNWLQKKVAADWVLELYDLAPKGSGIDHILFFNAVQNPALLETDRVHPLSDLIQEKFVWQLDQAGTFTFETEVEQDNEVVAIWLSSDGDDIGASYDIRFEEILLTVDPLTDP